MKTRESHFRLDAFGVVRVFDDGRIDPVLDSRTGRVMRLPTMQEAKREASRLTTLAGLGYDFAQGTQFRAHNIATDSKLARKPSLTTGCGFGHTPPDSSRLGWGVIEDF